MIRFTPATNHITPGALLWTDAEALDVADDDPRVNDGRMAVRVLSVLNGGRVLVSSMPGMPLTRAPLATVPASKLWIQTGLADDPTRPNAIQEHPDKAPTQMVFPAGIDMSKVGTPGAPAAVLARPAIVHADSETWQLECPTCPLSADGPPMICAWGVRVPGGGFMMKSHCPHNHGLRQDDAKRVTTGCAYSGVGE